MNKFFIPAIAALGIATPAFANGPSVEAQLGYDSIGVQGASGSISGVSYGGTLAYEMDVDRSIFLGAELSVDNNAVKECAGSSTVADPRVCVNFGREFGAALRGGVHVGENDDLYATVGYTNLRSTGSEFDGTTLSKGSANLNGIRVGAGYRHWFGARTYGKIEYRYSNYEQGIIRHQGLIGVGYQF
ncbi:MAG: hypothetical protein RLZZ366_198 [Pseudomonadota bacterium]|jgi:outer membrane immunogenic protein